MYPDTRGRHLTGLKEVENAEIYLLPEVGLYYDDMIEFGMKE